MTAWAHLGERPEGEGQVSPRPVSWRKGKKDSSQGDRKGSVGLCPSLVLPPCTRHAYTPTHIHTHTYTHGRAQEV